MEKQQLQDKDLSPLMEKQQLQNKDLPPPGPPPSYPSAASSRLLHIYTTGHSHRHVQILDSDKSTVLYTLEHTCKSKEHTKIYAGKSGDLIGTISFHNWASKIDLLVHGQSITMDSSGMWVHGYEYDSPAFGGARLKWKREGSFSSKIACQQMVGGQPVARFLEVGWAMKKEGRLELAAVVAGGGSAMDEVVIAGIAMEENARRKGANSAAPTHRAGGGIGGAGAGA